MGLEDIEESVDVFSRVYSCGIRLLVAKISGALSKVIRYHPINHLRMNLQGRGLALI